MINLQRLDLVSLSLFTLVVRTGSISKGAELSHLAIGAASRRVSDLEAAVGVALLERHSRGVRPTAAGRVLFDRARSVLKEVEHLSADLSDFASGVVGTIRLWANTSAITQFLPRELREFQSDNPGIRIELEEQNSSDIVLAVLDGRADCGIFADRTAAHGLRLLDYRRDRLVLVVPAGHPLQRRKAVAFAEAVDDDYVCLASNTSLSRRLHEETELLGRRLRVRIQVRSFDAMCLMVAHGMGVAVLPEAAIRPHLLSMHLKRIVLTDAWALRQLLIGVRDVEGLARPVRALVDHLCGGGGPA
jgi:DNA-binding transcriptional LysR family regulator